jgi:iron-sulfur cluster repair protein YtfE (RIC family)
MEESAISLIEKSFYKKIMLYNDLLNYFHEERVSLISVDLDKLWRISKEKEEICTKIESARIKILSAVNHNKDQKSFSLKTIMEWIPLEYKEKFQKLYLRLIKLKSEIEVVRKENMTFIDDSLKFLDEMISVIANESQLNFAYNGKCSFDASSSYFFVNREV